MSLRLPNNYLLEYQRERMKDKVEFMLGTPHHSNLLLELPDGRYFTINSAGAGKKPVF